MALAYIFMCIGLKTTPPVTASLISGIEPVLNPLLSALFWQEQVGTMALIGAAVILISVMGYDFLKAKQHS